LRIGFAVFLVWIGLPMSAGARGKVRLGRFVGLGKEVATFAAAPPLASTVSFRVRADRPNRLYVSNEHGPPRGPWRQSFVITSDVTQDGVREIQYVRPANDSHSGQRNLRMHNAWAAGMPPLVAMTGSGSVRVSGDRAEWSNVGSGQMRIGPDATMPIEWNEPFTGERKPTSRKAKR
jgi:hypothetical protein